MRITFLLPGFPTRPTGGARVVYEYANQLVAREHDVTVVHARRLPADALPPPHGRLDALRRRAGDLRLRMGPPTVRWQHIDPRVRMRFVPDLSPEHVPCADAIVATWWATAERLADYPPNKGTPFYLVQHYESWGGPVERVHATWRAPMTKIVIAKWLFDVGRELGVPQEELVHIPNAIDHQKFGLQEPIAQRPARIAMLSSEMEWKGGRDGARALKLVKARHPAAQAVAFGVEARPRWLPGWVEYRRDPEPADLVSDVYNGSAIYMCPAWTEGWHLPAAEAMGCGCAVATTDCGGVRDFVVEGETGLISPVRDPAALGHNVLRLLEEVPMRQRLARAGHEHIQEFTWTRSGKRLARVLESGATAGWKTRTGRTE